MTLSLSCSGGASQDRRYQVQIDYANLFCICSLSSHLSDTIRSCTPAWTERRAYKLSTGDLGSRYGGLGKKRSDGTRWNAIRGVEFWRAMRSGVICGRTAVRVESSVLSLMGAEVTRAEPGVQDRRVGRGRAVGWACLTWSSS